MQVKSLEGAPPLRKDTDFTYAAEILITKSELEDKNRRVFTLQQQVDETKTESEYQLRLKDNKYIEEGRIAKKKFNAELTEMKNVIQRMEADIVTVRQGPFQKWTEKSICEVFEDQSYGLYSFWPKSIQDTSQFQAATSKKSEKMETVLLLQF